MDAVEFRDEIFSFISSKGNMGASWQELKEKFAKFSEQSILRTLAWLNNEKKIEQKTNGRDAAYVKMQKPVFSNF